MLTLKTDFVFSTQYIRNLRGGSQPILTKGNDGLLYVVKFINNLQGPNLLFNESAGTELYRACGIAVPSWKPVLVTDAFLDQNPDCWMQTPEGRLRPDPGLCFGSRFLGGNGVRLLEILPKTSFGRVRNHKNFWLAWLIDIIARHSDNRQAVFTQLAEGGLNAFFIDNGHLFGGPKGELRPHFMASRFLDPRIYQRVSSKDIRNFQGILGSLDVDYLWKRIQALPDDWKSTSAMNGLAQCLDRLSVSDLLRNILDTMLEACQRTNGFERNNSENERKPPMAVLHPGVQAAGFEHCCDVTCARYSACA